LVKFQDNIEDHYDGDETMLSQAYINEKKMKKNLNHELKYSETIHYVLLYMQRKLLKILEPKWK